MIGSMAKTNSFTAEQFIKAIPGTGGVITSIAERVGCAWNTAKKYITEYPTIAQAYQNESERVTDMARSVVITDIVKKMRKEYGDKQEIELSGELDIEIVWPLEDEE